jgi:hypothetical protein
LSKDFINPDAQFIFHLLDNMTGVSDYFQALVSFRTLDFQPVRDLTFYIDLMVFNTFNFNFMIWHNFLWWIASCWLIQKLIKTSYPQLNSNVAFIITLAFLVYPLFAQSVAWGIARKHILALFFTSFLTEIWLRERTSFNWKESFTIVILYTFSVLSQPISLLWPCWAAVHLLLFKPQHLKSSLKIVSPLLLILISTVVINYFYYEMSPVFLSNNTSITKNEFNLPDKILAFGHYIFQIFVPYLLSYRYTLAHWSTLAGLVIFGVLIFIVRGLKIEKKWALSWGLFIILPIIMVLSNPSAQFDTYLLIPSLGILILLIGILQKLPKLPKKPVFISGALIIFVWTGLTNLESRSWLSELEMVKKSFERRPSCLTAADYLKSSYENEQPGPMEARSYIYTYECDKFSYAGKNLVILQSYMLFYENDLPMDLRLKKLQQLATYDFYPHTILISFYIKENMYKQADEEIEAFIKRWKAARFKPEYSAIIAQFMAPYCQKINNDECIKLTDSFVNKNPALFYK